MKILSILLFIVFYTQLVAQSTITIDQTKIQNGIYSYNNTPFSGVILKIENNLMLEKFTVKDGKQNGQFTEYFFDAEFKKENFRDTVLINSLESSLEKYKSVIPKLITDTINSFNSFSNYFNEEIGGAKKIKKLNEKFNSQKLKGDQLDLLNKYNSLKSQHNNSKQLLILVYADIYQTDKNLKTELNKPVFINRKKMVCNVLNGQKNGDYVEYYGNEKLKVKGTFRNNLQEGIWEYFNESGQIIAKGNFINGDGSNLSKVGVPRNGRDGTWTTYHTNGNIDQVSNWELGKQNGEFIVKNADGILIEESFRTDGKLNGNFKMYWPNGILAQETFFTDGKLNGTNKLYNIKGMLTKMSQFSNGKLNGNSKEYNDLGVLIVDDNYIDDKKNGMCREFFTNGNIENESLFKNGELNGNSKKYHENGKVEVDMTFKDNVLNGSVKNYFENGKISTETQYVKGNRHGPFKQYYESGQLKFVGFVDTNSQYEGHISGKATAYNEDGSIELIAIINNDGTVIDQTPKPKSIYSEAEIKKPYKCKCCKATINGIYDGVNDKGVEADQWTVEYLITQLSKPEIMKEISDIDGITSPYVRLRKTYPYCSRKCVNICY